MAVPGLPASMFPPPPAPAGAVPTHAEAGAWIRHGAREIVSLDPDAVVGAHVEQAIIFVEQAAAGAVAPPWFGPAMAAALAPVNANIAALTARSGRDEARSANYRATFGDWNNNNFPLTPLPLIVPVAGNPAGTLPGPAGVFFPAFANEIHSLTGAQLNALEAFYGVVFPGALVRDRQAAFRVWIAIA